MERAVNSPPAASKYGAVGIGTPYDKSMYIHMAAQRMAIRPKEKTLNLSDANAPMRPSGYSNRAATSRGDTFMVVNV